jgi:hypothetical protein
MSCVETTAETKGRICGQSTDASSPLSYCIYKGVLEFSLVSYIANAKGHYFVWQQCYSLPVGSVKPYTHAHTTASFAAAYRSESSAYRCAHFVWYIRRIRTAESVVPIRTSVTPWATFSIIPVDINRRPRSREYSNYMQQLWFANCNTNKVKKGCTL